MSIKLIDNSGEGLGVQVDALHNMHVNLPADEMDAGYAAIASCSDDGDATGTRLIRELDSDSDYRLRVGNDSMMFEYTFSGATINTSVWDTPIATSTVVQAGGSITLNNGGSTTVNQGSILRSKRYFPIYTTFPTSVEFIFTLSTTSFNNAIAGIGFGLIGTAPGTAAVDGIFMRITSDGVSLVVTNNLAELETTAVSFAALTTLGINLTESTHGVLVFGEDEIQLWLDETLVASRHRPASSPNNTAAMNGHIFARQFNSGTNTLNALKVSIAKVGVAIMAINYQKPWGHIKAGAGDMCQQGSESMTVGRTMAFNNYTTLPAQMTAPSATALGTGGSAGLGGIQRIGNGASTLALSADTSYIAFSYQVPAPQLTSPVYGSKNLYITGVKVDLCTRGAAGPANIGTFVVMLNFGATAVSPATTESATTPAKTARNVMVGQLSIPASAAVGALATGDARLDLVAAPVCVNPGEFIQIGVTPLVAYTISASQELIFTATFTGYWE